jgi:hypothetical protein
VLLAVVFFKILIYFVVDAYQLIILFPRYKDYVQEYHEKYEVYSYLNGQLEKTKYVSYLMPIMFLLFDVRINLDALHFVSFSLISLSYAFVYRVQE